MTKDNVTGKNKDFYDLGKKIFDRLNPQGAINPKVVEHVEPRREWQGLTEDEVAQAMYRADAIFTGPMQFKFAKEIEAKLKEKNT